MIRKKKYKNKIPGLFAQRLTLFNSSRGFTILELIVSLAIIALLLGVVINGIAGSRQRTRDVKRVDEIKQLQNALQLYHNDNQSYPATLDRDILVPAYIKALPKDPATAGDYLYAALLVRSTCNNYHLGATLETVPPNTGVLETDFDAIASQDVCSGSNADFSGDDPVYDVHP
ncbi:MAG: type II secretion system protein [Patescibacteria group bacterium]